MATAGVKDGGWWLGCGVWAREKTAGQSQHSFFFGGKYGVNEQRRRGDEAKEKKGIK